MRRRGRDTRAVTNLAKEFGQTLREIRKERNLSQEQLAFETGYHRTYISLLERGINSPSLDTVFRLAEILNLAPSEMVSRLEKAHRSQSSRSRTDRKPL